VLILVRHGRTEANAAGLLIGHLDPDLDDVGRRQAELIEAALVRPARVVSSPLRRAMSTAERLGVNVEIDERWIELDYGDFDGTPIVGLGRDIWNRWRRDVSYTPPNGESIATMATRVMKACEELAPEAMDVDIVVVSHVSPIKAALAWALAAGPEIAWRSHLDVASICRISYNANTPVLRSFNETWHLDRRVT
jgi:broad specificity phosphatase PhoE